MGLTFSLSCDPLVPALHYLEDNLEALQIEMRELNAMRNDLLRWVLKEEDRGLQMSPEVKGWISRVGKIESDANYLLDESISVIQRISMYGFCSLFCASTYQYSKRVATMLRQVETLRWEGVFEVVAQRTPGMKNMPALQSIVSQEKLLESIWRDLMDVNVVGTLGIYGRDGIGKTSLLTQIQDKFIGDGYKFGLVILAVEASKEIDIIQNEIGKRLGIQWGRETEKEKAAVILTVLKGKRFLLLLDDIHKELNLEEIGVPYPSIENGCKIVFTSRSQESCGSKWVDAKFFEVTCLPPQEAWKFFEEIVGETTLASHPDIPKLATIVAEKCHGLPLALRVIGGTMADRKTVHEWRQAIHVLIASGSEISGFEDEMLSILRFSYDILPDDKVRSCFLYCALFPEDDIRRQDLVDSWIGEGMVADEIKGYEMINDFVRMRLLEDTSRYDVKMCDMFRDMALRIASDDERQKELFVVKGDVRTQEMPDVKDWNMFTKMSVTSTLIKNIWILDFPDGSKLTTLFLQGNKNLQSISGDFFHWMINVVVLNLSYNSELVELPEEVSCMVSLQFLNLTGTPIKLLPLGLKELKRLIHLDLEHIPELKGIEVIASLFNLKVLRLIRSVPMDLKLIKDIQLLKSLKELSLTVKEDAVFQRLLSIYRLASCIRRLHLNEFTIIDGGILLLNAALSLRELDIQKCDIPEITVVWKSNMIPRMTACFGNFEKIPQLWHLGRVSLDMCNGLSDLTWLLFAPCLEDLSVTRCFSIKKIISREKEMAQQGHMNEQPFHNITKLALDGLRELESIYWTPLLFPVLEYLKISDCPKLKKLPFNSESAKENQIRLFLDDTYIKGVEWEDEATAQRFYALNNSGYHG